MLDRRFAARSVLFICLALLLLVSVRAQPTASEEPAQRDIRLADGSWSVDSVFKGGKKLDKDSRRGEKNAHGKLLAELSIKGNHVTMVLTENGAYEFQSDCDIISANFTINTSVYPKTCDVVFDKLLALGGKDNGSELSKWAPIPCIYEIDAGTLVICFSQENNALTDKKRRPTNLGKDINDLEKDVVKFVFHHRSKL
jgi:uncharacterized protein (TIGR03067 family)